MKTVYWIIFALLCPTCAAVQEVCASEIEIIRAAIRNKCTSKTDFAILLAIRLQENGRAGLEFGIMHPDANDLDSQAGWCAATIVKNRKRWLKAGRPWDFITFLALRYCPPSADFQGHINWIKNVRYFVRNSRLRSGMNVREAPEASGLHK
ncbi:hypothetical protein LCGC14_2179820 [marine sediment metagenome]|uniref:Transglycosylase SLT domain-containing protein n=1 Tax=marine sediment metagenome TaxID=412755 RepID=A0A0F9G051_9ZZZZ